MKSAAFILLAAALVPAEEISVPSGRIGIYAIVESVTVEPSQGVAERIRIHGAFSYAEQHCADCMFGGDLNRQMSFSPPSRGYLYFQLPPLSASITESVLDAMRREWNDIKSVAGSGQAIAFGSWRYVGSFDFHIPFADSVQRRILMNNQPAIRAHSDSASALPVFGPQIYEANVGVVKLTAASHPAVIRQLQAALNNRSR